MSILEFISIILFTEAVTEIVVKSEIFRPLRKKLFDLGQNNRIFMFLHDLIDCGYCFSVWAALSFVVLLNYFSENNFIYLFMLGIIVHRLSNIIHNLIDKTRTN